MPKLKQARHYTCAKCSNSKGHQNTISRTVTFPTADLLDKHLEAEHKSSMFTCTALGCFKSGSAPKFQKSETLTQHVKESHDFDTEYTCPIQRCSDHIFTTIDDLASHANMKHMRPSIPTSRSQHRVSEKIIPFYNAATWTYFRCPLQRCGKCLSGGHDKVSNHLNAHTQDELISVVEILEGLGYELNFLPIESTEGNPLTTSVRIKCPACEARCDSDASFRCHIEADHMLAKTPGMLEHFQTWRKDVKPWVYKEHAKRFPRRPCWMSTSDVLRSSASRSESGCKCSHPQCSFVMDVWNTEHPSFLRAAEEITTDLAPHRKELLRHYPEMSGCPMLSSGSKDRH